MKKKILIIHASFGGGHKSVAINIEKYLNKKNKDFEIKVIDIVDYPSIFGKLYGSFYKVYLRYRPKNIITLLYKLGNNKINSSTFKEFARALYNSKIKDEIETFNPDLTISTSPFATTIIDKLNKKKLINTKVIVVITDHNAHEFWIRSDKTTNAYVISNEIMKRELISKGINKNKLMVFGIPISDKFNKKEFNKNKVLSEYKLKDDMKTALFFGGGGEGSLSYFKFFKKLVKHEFNLQIFFVAAKNDKLKQKCEKYIQKNNIKNILVLGYSDDVPNLMNISDFIITKPGGITITECLELKKPMILIPGYGAQEVDNAKYLLKKRYALKCYSPMD